MAVTVKQIGRCGETRLKELSVTEIGERGDRQFFWAARVLLIASKWLKNHPVIFIRKKNVPFSSFCPFLIVTEDFKWILNLAVELQPLSCNTVHFIHVGDRC